MRERKWDRIWQFIWKTEDSIQEETRLTGNEAVNKDNDSQERKKVSVGS